MHFSNVSPNSRHRVPTAVAVATATVLLAGPSKASASHRGTHAAVAHAAGASTTDPSPAVAPGVSPTADLDLQTLLTAFSEMPGLQARFVEEKHMRLLAAPLVSKGRLYFTRPGYLARHVESPSPSKVLISPDMLRYSDRSGEGQIDLRARPDVKLFVESFVRVLAGDEAGLATVYAIYFEAPTAAAMGWTLVLTPKSLSLRKLISRLTITGQGLAVHELKVEETSGDWSVTRISDVNPARIFSMEERRRLFGASRE
ncbi:MAG: outer membrane lipoprotein carrier protein LolA [Nannocystaceae bacterium]